MQQSSHYLVEAGLTDSTLKPWYKKLPSHATMLASASTAVLIILTGAAHAQAFNTVVEGAPITVPGTHSSPWGISNNLMVGDSLDGTLVIEAGGKVTTPTARIGSDNVTGIVTVKDTGSLWDNDGNLAIGVGYRGFGFLNVLNGGMVSNTVGEIGGTDGTGTVIVSGSGSRWINSQLVVVGYAGAGTLIIDDGGTVSAPVTYVGGDYPSAQGTLTLGATAGNRGILATDQITRGVGGAKISFNGGILRATDHNDNLISLDFAPGEVQIGAGGAFIDSNGHNIGIGVDLAGDGGLTKLGSGTLDLSGFNTYSGGTSINGGVLVTYSDDSLGDASGSLTLDNGTLRFGLPFDLAETRAVILGSGGGTFDTVFYGFNSTIRSNITGSGGLTKTGAGTLTLTGNNSYSGGTTILGGTLVANSASLRGPVLNNAALVFDQIVDGTFSDNISGSGSLTKNGTGALTLTGTNTYAGGTFVNGGTLVIGSPDALADGPVTYDGGVLRFAYTGSLDRPISFGPAGFTVDMNGNTQTMSAPVTGNGAFIKAGDGSLNLTGDSPGLTGPTLIQAGRLAVNGSLPNSVVTVTGGSLGGTGTVGGIVAQSGGTVAPGNSIGTLKVAGDVAFQAGSVYQVEVNAAGQADKIAATGHTTLSGGTVQVRAATGTYRPSTTYTILTAGGGVAGTFAGVSANFAYLDPTLAYDATSVSLTLARKTDPTEPTPPPLAFHSVAVSANQYRTADAVEALAAGNRLFDAVIGQSVAGARQAFDALSGEAHASAATVAYEDDRLVREAILTRLRQPLAAGLPAFAQGRYPAAFAADRPGAAPQPVAVPLAPAPRYALWGEGFGAWGRVDGTGNAASLDTSTGSFVLGADTTIDPTYRIGLAGGFTRTTFDVDGRLSSGSNDSVFAALYGSGSWGGLSLRLGASYAWHDFDVSRTVSFPGFADRTHASYDGWSAQAFGELGYRIGWGAVQLEPFVGAAVLRLHTDGFVEEGGPAALTGSGQDQDLATTTLGVRAEARLSAELPLTVRGLLGWRHAYGDVEPESLLAFAGGAAFAVAGVPVDRDALVAEAGLDWQASDALSLGIAYSGQIGARAQDHALKGKLTWRFGTY